MKTRHKYILQLPSLSCVKHHTFSAILLLTLLTTSYILENSMLFQGDTIELLESSEKEIDKTENKLLLFSFDLNLKGPSSSMLSGISYFPLFTLSGVYLDFETPPPEQC